MIPLEDRCKLVDMVKEAHDDGASLYKACQTAGITVRTLQRCIRPANTPTQPVNELG